MSKMKIAVMGAGGRMGSALIQAVQRSRGCILGGAVEMSGSPAVGKDAGVVAGLEPIGVAISDDALAVISKVDAILDFTAPAATLEFAALAANARIVHVIGTTGIDDVQQLAIEAAARHATIIKAGNMSLGVNLLVAIAERVAAVLDEDYDIEIVEMHHKHKVDAPSGTALMLGEAAARGRKVSLAERSVRSRDGHTGPRRRGDIGFATLRGGNVVGDHTIIFAGDGERLEFTHRANDREIFARGAVKAALWGAGKGPGLFSMSDVLAL